MLSPSLRFALPLFAIFSTSFGFIKEIGFKRFLHIQCLRPTLKSRKFQLSSAGSENNFNNTAVLLDAAKRLRLEAAELESPSLGRNVDKIFTNVDFVSSAGLKRSNMSSTINITETANANKVMSYSRNITVLVDKESEEKQRGNLINKITGTQGTKTNQKTRTDDIKLIVSKSSSLEEKDPAEQLVFQLDSLFEDVTKTKTAKTMNYTDADLKEFVILHKDSVINRAWWPFRWLANSVIDENSSLLSNEDKANLITYSLVMMEIVDEVFLSHYILYII